MAEFLGETPSLAAVVNEALDAFASELNVSIPGQIEKYDPATQKADVTPLLQRTFRNGETKTLPVIPNVPVKQMRSGTAIIAIPINQGDSGTLLFHQRSLDTWLSKGGVVDPNDNRRHALSDAEFIPGLFPFSEPGKAEADNILINVGDMTVRMTPGGKIQIQNSSAELLDLFNQLIDTLLAEAFIVNKATLTAIKLLLTTMRV